MARADKQAAVAEIVESFNDSAGAVLTEYRGLTVKQLQELRRSLGANANYAVVKNTLAKLAAKDAGIDGFDDLLTGPTAIAFIKGDGTIFSILKMDPSPTALYGPMGNFRFALEARAGFYESQGIRQGEARLTVPVPR